MTPYLLNHTDVDAIVSAGGLRGIVADLPEWCKRPGHETNVWLNAALAQLWPHLSTALSEKIGGAIGKILAKKFGSRRLCRGDGHFAHMRLDFRDGLLDPRFFFSRLSFQLGFEFANKHLAG